VRYIGHLDMLRMTYRLVRASGLPVVYSEGYNQHPQVSFGPPLPLGMISKYEYFDLKLSDTSLTDDYVEKTLKRVFPPGMQIVEVISPVIKAMRSMEYYQKEEIKLEFPENMIDIFQAKLINFQSEKKWQFTRIRKGKEKVVDLKDIISEMKIEGSSLNLIKKITGASIYDLLEHVFGIQRVESSGLNIQRIKLIK